MIENLFSLCNWYVIKRLVTHNSVQKISENRVREGERESERASVVHTVRVTVKVNKKLA